MKAVVLNATVQAASASPTVTKERAKQTNRQPYPNYKVIVLNDDFNTFQHVAETLVKYIPHMTPDQAWKLTNQVHYEGQATVWVGPLEQAELYHSQLIRAGLTMGSLGESLAMGSTPKAGHGRVVLNHSTHIPGLIPLLHKLSAHPQIKTLTPAVITRGRSNAPKFRLKPSVPILGGFKLIARKGKSIQEVFVITDLSAEQLAAAIEAVM